METFRALGYCGLFKRQRCASQKLDLQNTPDLPHGLPWPVKFQGCLAYDRPELREFPGVRGWPLFSWGMRSEELGGSGCRRAGFRHLRRRILRLYEQLDGSMIKQWKPWDGSSAHDPYFELALVTG